MAFVNNPIVQACKTTYDTCIKNSNNDNNQKKQCKTQINTCCSNYNNINIDSIKYDFNNDNFKGIKCDAFKNESYSNSFSLTPQK